MTFFVAEIVFRSLLFSDLSVIQKYRNESLYADWWRSEEWWKMRYVFGNGVKHSTVHPQLGWVSKKVSPDTYEHISTGEINGRKPVLLYGDSFARGTKATRWQFEDILNNDEMFSKKHYFLNYGVSGYGVDQIFLLFQKSIEYFDSPFVVLSIMTDDVRRSMNSVRECPKPYFQIEHDTLKLCGVPLLPDSNVFYSSNPPKTKLYLYQLLIRKIIPANRIRLFFKTANPKVLVDPNKLNDDMVRLNRKIILEIIKILNEKKIKYVFLIFHFLLICSHN